MRINRQITANELFVISETGEKLGNMSFADALTMAESEGKDLVEIVPNANPPVCKIIEFSKFQYQQAKNSKQKKTPDLKEFRLGLNIGDHDLSTKLNQMNQLIVKGHPLKIVIRFFGREITHKDQGIALINKIKASMPNTIFDDVKEEGRSLIVMVRKTSGK